MVLLHWCKKELVSTIILQNTGAKQTLICGDVLPFSAESYCGSDVLAWGVKRSVVHAPLHFVHLIFRFVSGKFKLAVRPQLPIAGVDLILRNDLAGGYRPRFRVRMCVCF